jgi:hypothetical protein
MGDPSESRSGERRRVKRSRARAGTRTGEPSRCRPGTKAPTGASGRWVIDSASPPTGGPARPMGPAAPLTETELNDVETPPRKRLGSLCRLGIPTAVVARDRPRRGELLDPPSVCPSAQAPIAPSGDLGEMGEAIAGQIYRTAAMFGQYLLPAIFLLGAVGSAWKAYRNRRSFAQASVAPNGVRSAAPACPSCGAAMARRVAKRGAKSGQEFWGCSRYPACKGTR